MRNELAGAIAASLVLAAGAAARPVVDTITDANPGATNVVLDGVLGMDEYGPGNSYSFGGGGAGFGGTLGAGRIYMDQDADNLYIGIRLGGNLNDNVAMWFDTRAGGFTDAMMNDTNDPGRNISTNLTRDSDDQFDAGFLPDFSMVVGSFGMVTFELNGNPLINFVQFSGQFTGNDAALVREICIPKASFGIGNGFRFMAGYFSDTNFASDEAIPAQPFSGMGNPGFGDAGAAVVWANYNEFNKIPAPATGALLGLGLLAAGRRRR